MFTVQSDWPRVWALAASPGTWNHGLREARPCGGSHQGFDLPSHQASASMRRTSGRSVTVALSEFECRKHFGQFPKRIRLTRSFIEHAGTAHFEFTKKSATSQVVLTQVQERLFQIIQLKGAPCGTLRYAHNMAL